MSTLRHCWDTYQMARFHAALLERPLLDVICECLKKQIEYEQGPKCGYCGSPDVFVAETYTSTGVVAPDGGHERVYSEWLQCRRCGNRETK